MARPRLSLTAALVTATVVLAGCSNKPDAPGSGGGGSADHPLTMTAVVLAKDFFFEPRDVWIKRGGGVEWRASGSASHTADSDDDTWHAGSIPPGNPPSLGFSDVGDHPYHCENHAQMRGVIHVVA